MSVARALSSFYTEATVYTSEGRLKDLLDALAKAVKEAGDE